MVRGIGNKNALKWTPAQIQKLCDDANAYFDEAKNRKVTEIVVSQSDNHTTTKEKAPAFPSLHEFQITYNYCNYIYELEKQHESVSECFTRIRILQSVFAQRHGLDGLYSAPVVKMALMNNKELNWTEKSESNDKLNVDAQDNFINLVLNKAKKGGK